MMTPLQQPMLEELQRRNYGSGTIRLYLGHVADVAQPFSPLTRSTWSRADSSVSTLPHSGEEAGLVKL
jgi:hypothetical protein